MKRTGTLISFEEVMSRFDAEHVPGEWTKAIELHSSDAGIQIKPLAELGLRLKAASFLAATVLIL